MSTQFKTNPLLLLVQDRRFEVYTGSKKQVNLLRDALAGLIVALVSIPLGIGFAIASGLKPEQGIMAGAIACILGGLFGGSKYQIYGPTAAFIPLLSSIVGQYDVPFLIFSSVIAGLFIIGMGLLKLGNHFSKIPFSVTVGFTIGIALSIALGQLPDALGGGQQGVSVHTLNKIQMAASILEHPNIWALLLAILSFFIIKACYRISVFIPGPLIAILIAMLLEQTVPGTNGVPLVADRFGPMPGDLFKLTLPALGSYPIWTLISPVLSIVFIASLESLLSARMADRLAGNQTTFNPNQELIGQGIVNTLVPLLNGFPCTGAFARTATSIKAGAASPFASLFKGVFVIILMVFFAQYITMIPMACISGLLLYVALNMVKADELRHVLKGGKLPTFLMIYTALVTIFTDLFIAVSSATVIHYLVNGFLQLQLKAKLAIQSSKVTEE